MQQRGEDADTEVSPVLSDGVLDFGLAWEDFVISNIDLLPTLSTVSRFPEPNSELTISNPSPHLDSLNEVITSREYLFHEDITSTLSVLPIGFPVGNPVLQSTLTVDVRHKPKRLIFSFNALTFKDTTAVETSAGK
jgi:hypothetical protein